MSSENMIRMHGYRSPPREEPTLPDAIKPTSPSVSYPIDGYAGKSKVVATHVSSLSATHGLGSFIKPEKTEAGGGEFDLNCYQILSEDTVHRQPFSF